MNRLGLLVVIGMGVVAGGIGTRQAMASLNPFAPSTALLGSPSGSSAASTTFKVAISANLALSGPVAPVRSGFIPLPTIGTGSSSFTAATLPTSLKKLRR